MSWLPIATAPKDGTVINLRGKFRRTDPGDPVEIVGHYGKNWFSKGWEDQNGCWFCPDEWKPL